MKTLALHFSKGVSDIPNSSLSIHLHVLQAKHEVWMMCVVPQYHMIPSKPFLIYLQQVTSFLSS